MNIMNSFFAAISMYSIIPVKQVKWEEENIRYSICFFPLVGLVTGFAFVIVAYIFKYLSFSNNFSSAIATVIPTLISGGIHMDGFCDTVDALASHQSIERKIEIMKDSNSGAFAVIAAVIYYLLYFGAISQIGMQNFKCIFIIGIGFVLSRTLSGLSLLWLKGAKSDGLAAYFKNSSKRNIVTGVLVFYMVLCILLMIKIDMWIGGTVISISFLIAFYYKKLAYKQFHGTTGDLAGFFLSLCELGIIMSVCIMERLVDIWSL